MRENWKFSHVAIIVRDMDKAIKHYDSFGIGPFPPGLGGKLGAPVDYKTVRDKPVDYDMDLRTAEPAEQRAIELIQPIEGESDYERFLEEKGEGVHHVAFIVDDLDKETDEMTKAGFKVIQTGGAGKGRWHYFDTDAIGGVIIELIGRKS